MADWPLLGGSSRAGFLPTGDPTRIFTFTPGSPNQKTSWGQLVASIPFDCMGFALTVYAIGSSAAGSNLLDIGIGASGSEQVLIPDIHFHAASDRNTWTMYFPIALRAGERLAVRGQNTNASTAIDYYLGVELYARTVASPEPLTACTSYGAVYASSRGTQINGSSGMGTPGSWVQLAASCDPASALMVSASMTASASGWQGRVELGIGPSGSEQVIAGGFVFGSQPSSNVLTVPVAGPFPVAVPGGQRLAARLRSSSTSSNLYVMAHLLR